VFISFAKHTIEAVSVTVDASGRRVVVPVPGGDVAAAAAIRVAVDLRDLADISVTQTPHGADDIHVEVAEELLTVSCPVYRPTGAPLALPRRCHVRERARVCVSRRGVSSDTRQHGSIEHDVCVRRPHRSAVHYARDGIGRCGCEPIHPR
jgi:hypothetical protein